MPKLARRPLRALFLAAAFGLASAAQAHNESYPVAGDDVLVCTDAASCTGSFHFEATGADVVLVDHDPRSDGAQLLVRGLGANGGRTALISTDRNLWTPISGGFQYSDPVGSRGGITAITLTAGSLTIDAAGPGFPWAPAGAQDAVWVHFRLGDVWYCAEFPSGSASANGANLFDAAGAAAPGECPEQVCGNGIPEPGEQCDDGNLESGDGCEATCEIGPCNATNHPSTFEAIQEVVFEGGYSCTNELCHDSVAPKEDLELTRSAAYENLLGADGLGAASTGSTLERVEPGEPELSFLYLKLAAATYPELGLEVGTPMPNAGAPPLSEEHLEAVRKWIRGGAPETGVVEGTAELLGTCLPPPTPLKIPVPAPPPPGAGVQLVQTPWPLPGIGSDQGEDEICMATWYDFSEVVPESAKVPCPPLFAPQKACSNALTQVCSSDVDCAPPGTCIVAKNATNPTSECFAYDKQTLVQDPQSHHSIIQLYTGAYDVDAEHWGEWTYKFEPGDPNAALDGDPCDPTEIDPLLGYNPGCSGEVVSRVACVGYGPPDASGISSATGNGGTNTPSFSGSQEPYYEQDLAPGVYNTLPLRGVVVWNSHAFNLTPTDSTMAQYLNLEFASEDDQLYPARGIFDSRWIFAQNVPAFGTQDICATTTLPQGAQLFNLSSHTHLRGVKWRTWAPPNTPCRPACPPGTVIGCNTDASLPLCSGPRADAPIYYSTQYSDPLQLDLDPPMALDSPEPAERTLLFCSLFDNGSTETSPPVKRQSTSPEPPPVELFGSTFTYPFGGKCADALLTCVEGPNQGLPCFAAGGDSFCGGEGLCDACPMTGGVTTEDEMFILLGTYYIPEPDPSLLGLAAIATLAAAASRRLRSTPPS